LQRKIRSRSAGCCARKLVLAQFTRTGSGPDRARQREEEMKLDFRSDRGFLARSLTSRRGGLGYACCPRPFPSVRNEIMEGPARVGRDFQTGAISPNSPSLLQSKSRLDRHRPRHRICSATKSAPVRKEAFGYRPRVNSVMYATGQALEQKAPASPSHLVTQSCAMYRGAVCTSRPASATVPSSKSVREHALRLGLGYLELGWKIEARIVAVQMPQRFSEARILAEELRRWQPRSQPAFQGFGAGDISLPEHTCDRKLTLISER